MPNSYTTNSSLFPPKTKEVRFDEKWDFAKKRKKIVTKTINELVYQLYGLTPEDIAIVEEKP
jgi:hypothetical protein